MSCDLWKYSDECLGRVCPGDCDLCDFEPSDTRTIQLTIGEDETEITLFEGFAEVRTKKPPYYRFVNYEEVKPMSRLKGFLKLTAYDGKKELLKISQIKAICEEDGITRIHMRDDSIFDVLESCDYIERTLKDI